MPPEAPATPRKMLPPPITMAMLDAHRVHRLDLGGEARDDLGIEAVALIAHQRLARQLQQDAAVFHVGRVGRIRWHRAHDRAGRGLETRTIIHQSAGLRLARDREIDGARSVTAPGSVLELGCDLGREIGGAAVDALAETRSARRR